MPPSLSELRQTLLLHSLEETDALGKVVPLDARERATREAGDEAEFLTARSTSLLRQCSERVRRAVDWGVHPPWGWMKYGPAGLIVGALLVGWFSNELGPDRIINILAFPLLGLILWNVAVCSFMLVAEFRKGPQKAPQRLFPEEARLREQLEKRVLHEVTDPAERELMSRSVMNFLRTWREKHRDQVAAKSKLVFHLAALTLALALVAGMYVQGLRKEYRAAWESTFLDAPQVHSLLNVILGPASKLSGIAIPAEWEINYMRIRPGEPVAAAAGSAAPFIHLWAVSAGIFIFIPRLILIGLAAKQFKRAAPDWSAELASIEEKARAESAGQTAVVDVLPVYFEPETSTAEAIRQCVLQVWGGKTRLHFQSKMELGEEEEALAEWQPATSGTVLAFSFASTPEQDVQGEVIQQVAARSPKLLIVTDALGFEERHGSLPEFEQRMAQRKAAWQRVIGTQHAWINLTQATVKQPLQAIDALRAAGII